MEFQFHRQHDIATNIRAQLIDQVQRAINHLQDYRATPEISVHKARVAFKRSRTLLRLVKADIGNQAFDESNGLLRNLGRNLSAQRDAHVISTKMRALLLQLDLDQSADVRECSNEISDADIELAIAALHQLDVLRVQIMSMQFMDQGFSLVWQASIDLCERERRVHMQALETGHDDDYHEWRKAAKHLYHWSCLLKPSWPSRLTGLEQELLQLTRLLGRYHDYVLLRDPLTLDLFELSDSDKTIVVEAIREEQKMLRVEAEQVRGQLVMGQAEEFVMEVEQHWNAW